MKIEYSTTYGFDLSIKQQATLGGILITAEFAESNLAVPGPDIRVLWADNDRRTMLFSVDLRCICVTDPAPDGHELITITAENENEHALLKGCLPFTCFHHILLVAEKEVCA